MRIHALESSGGLTYSQMARYASADGKGTNDAAKATQVDGGQPLDNPARNVWISETALSTALNVSYMAGQLALFGVVVGIALLLSGIGFLVLAAFGTVTVLLDNALLGGYAATMPLAAERYGTATLGGDFAALARALGVEAERVEQPGELAPALARALALGASGAPALVSVHTHEEAALSKFW